MADGKRDPSELALDLVALMRTGADPMTSYDPSIPIDPDEDYNPHRHFQKRISADDAKLVGIGEAYENFEANRLQLIALAHLPAESFTYAIRFHKLRREVDEGNAPPLEKNQAPFDRHPTSLFSPLSQAVRDCMNGKRELPPLSEEELSTYFHVAGVAALGNPEHIGPSLKAFAISVLSQSWQAFEVLAEDLLNDAISNNPSKFPGMASPIEIRGALTGQQGIRANYEKAFGVTAKSILEPLADQHLDYTVAIRNLFAHKAGRTDQQYLDRVSKLTLAKIVRPNVGELFPISGSKTHELGDHCFSMGYCLLKEVYIWLKK